MFVLVVKYAFQGVFLLEKDINLCFLGAL